MYLGNDFREQSRHLTLVVLIEDHDFRDTSIMRSQESNSFGSGGRYGVLAFNVCIVDCVYTFRKNDAVINSLPWDP